jgi:hypothetical protein
MTYGSIQSESVGIETHRLGVQLDYEPEVRDTADERPPPVSEKRERGMRLLDSGPSWAVSLGRPGRGEAGRRAERQAVGHWAAGLSGKYFFFFLFSIYLFSKISQINFSNKIKQIHTTQ